MQWIVIFVAFALDARLGDRCALGVEMRNAGSDGQPDEPEPGEDWVRARL
jgi:hypothetical protein